MPGGSVLPTAPAISAWFSRGSVSSGPKPSSRWRPGSRPCPRRWFYLGYLDGEPVATAEAALHAGTVALFGIATLPPFRHRGIGSRMTWQPLLDASAAGCDLAALQAADAGVGLYRRLGFAPFGEITEYKLPPG